MLKKINIFLIILFLLILVIGALAIFLKDIFNSDNSDIELEDNNVIIEEINFEDIKDIELDGPNF